MLGGNHDDAQESKDSTDDAAESLFADPVSYYGSKTGCQDSRDTGY